MSIYSPVATRINSSLDLNVMYHLFVPATKKYKKIKASPKFSKILRKDQEIKTTFSNSSQNHQNQEKPKLVLVETLFV